VNRSGSLAMAVFFMEPGFFETSHKEESANILRVRLDDRDHDRFCPSGDQEKSKSYQYRRPYDGRGRRSRSRRAGRSLRSVHLGNRRLVQVGEALASRAKGDGAISKSFNEPARSSCRDMGARRARRWLLESSRAEPQSDVVAVRRKVRPLLGRVVRRGCDDLSCWLPVGVTEPGDCRPFSSRNVKKVFPSGEEILE